MFAPKTIVIWTVSVHFLEHFVSPKTLCFRDIGWASRFELRLGIAHKIRPQSEGIQGGYFADKWGGDSSDVEVRNFWSRKNIGFSTAVRTDKRWGVNLSRFCANVLYGRPLSRNTFSVKRIFEQVL